VWLCESDDDGAGARVRDAKWSVRPRVRAVHVRWLCESDDDGTGARVRDAAVVAA